MFGSQACLWEGKVVSLSAGMELIPFSLVLLSLVLPLRTDSLAPKRVHIHGSSKGSSNLLC
jgi:hypothetical protein